MSKQSICCYFLFVVLSHGLKPNMLDLRARYMSIIAPMTDLIWLVILF